MRYFLSVIFMLSSVLAFAQRTESALEEGWRFSKGDFKDAMSPCFDDSSWENVKVPHDWAISGPFDRSNDLQEVAVTQNFETAASVKTGRTGGLPYVGVGWYRLRFDVPEAEGKSVSLLFDGAMSEARVFVNGREVCFWPLGYNSFHCDITDCLNKDGKDNLLAVRLENRPQSSRWYPGAGLYRNVHLIVTSEVHVPVWGTQVTTPYVDDSKAIVNMKVAVDNAGGKAISIVSSLFSPEGVKVGSADSTYVKGETGPFVQDIVLENPLLWSPETPAVYKAVTEIYADGVLSDRYVTDFGIRTIEIVPDKGFVLNGVPRKFKGVCNHHDLGPLGAAVNESALRKQLEMLKDMGCDAIRTAHNMPAPELVRLCDEMGFMMMLEPFDEWDIAKCMNGYHRFFDEWAEKDMVNMLHHYRNNPSVVMWSIGNEVPTQCSPEGYKVADFLQEICHREDPGRPVTCGMDQVSCVLENGFAALLDVPGFNYRSYRYEEAYSKLPQRVVLGSETTSTVSSRGVYKFPVEKKPGAIYEDNQSSSYDVEYCDWSNVPDEDLALAEDFEWTMGQFVWTGFDYLGEPSPYDTDEWPSHSSLFGIIDLAYIPKDRYYLYRSVWNTASPTLHVLPHWTWPGREGENTPVFVYTSYPSAELFVNGKSYGVRKKLSAEESRAMMENDSWALQKRFRLMWMDVPYEPGELKVVAYDLSGNAVDTAVVRTAGSPHHIELIPDRTSISADGKDLAFIRVRIVDRDGNLCPSADNMVRFDVGGAGSFKAVANGDATCLEPFQNQVMHCFSGEMTVIVESGEKPGILHVRAYSDGLYDGNVAVSVAGD